jgi:hypothetical protein
MERQLLSLLKGICKALGPTQLDMQAAAKLRRLLDDLAQACSSLPAEPLCRREELLS